VIRTIIVGIIALLIVVLFIRQIVHQLRSGKVRLRGWRDYKTRKDHPVWYWSSVGAQIAVLLIFLYLFSQTVLKASK
jgi:hypothetical protein